MQNEKRKPNTLTDESVNNVLLSTWQEESYNNRHCIMTLTSYIMKKLHQNIGPWWALKQTVTIFKTNKILSDFSWNIEIECFNFSVCFMGVRHWEVPEHFNRWVNEWRTRGHPYAPTPSRPTASFVCHRPLTLEVSLFANAYKPIPHIKIYQYNFRINWHPIFERLVRDMKQTVIKNL